LLRVNEVFAQSKVIKLQLSSQVSREVLESFGTVKAVSTYNATLEVPRLEVKARSKAILDQLPVVDFNIEDIPVELPHLVTQRRLPYFHPILPMDCYL
jgi:ABC-2 type transport system ATP-binding protein